MRQKFDVFVGEYLERELANIKKVVHFEVSVALCLASALDDFRLVFGSYSLGG